MAGFIVNMYTFGCSAALTGLIIARLQESTSEIRMTKNEESWFCKYKLVKDFATYSLVLYL